MKLSISQILIIALLVMPLSLAQTPPSDVNINFYYTLDNSNISAPTVYDVTDYGNDATLVNAPTAGVAGIIDQAITFASASSQYINAPSQDAFDTGDATVCGWFKTIYSGYYTIFSEGSSSSGAEYVLVRTTPTGQLTFDIKETAVTYSSSNITNDAWHFFCAVDDSGTMALYMDGSYRGTNQSTPAFTGNQNAFGVLKRTGLEDYYRGSLDELSLFNYSLDKNEMDYLYDDGSPGSEQQWPFFGGGR